MMNTLQKTKISHHELYDLLLEDTSFISDYQIIINNETLQIDLGILNIDKLNFNNCELKGNDGSLIFITSLQREIQEIKIQNCSIKCSIEFENISCNLLSIKNSNLNNNYLNSINGDFKSIIIENSEFYGDDYFEFGEISNSYITIRNSIFHKNINFSVFNKASIHIKNSNFSKSFNYFSTQNSETSILDSTFSIFGMEECIFDNNLHINNCSIKKLNLLNNIFDKNFSLQNNIISTIIIDGNIFSKSLLLDNTRIQNPEKCDRITLRTIKQLLKESDNTIDSNKFKSYELNAYRKELKQEKKQKGDQFILWLNHHFSRHGNECERALWMTLAMSSFFYGILYLGSNFSNEWYFRGINDFFVGYFKFFLISNFYNPLTENREYIQNAWQWLPFIIGKLVIGFGLYETVQSFRKYRK